jgi:hypothetical protein
MKLAHGIYYSRRRQQIRAVYNGTPFAYGHVRDIIKRDGSQSEGRFRHYIGSLLVSFGMHVEDAFTFAVGKVKYLPKLAPGVSL